MNQTKRNFIYMNTGRMRKLALNMGRKAKGKGAHFGAGMSAMEIFSSLYGGAMQCSPDAEWGKQDVLVVGKAHCVLAYYTALAVYGFVQESELETFDEDGSLLPGHPMMNEKWGISFSGGSLGMALSQGVGVALSRKRRGQSSQVFVLLGDGECQEGAIWEAAMSATHFKLDNLTVIIDRNHLQYDGDTEEIMALGDLAEKWRSFGFQTYKVNGNRIEEIYPALVQSRERTGCPVCIIADTVKGKGISFMEGKKEWHHKRISEEEYQQAMRELEENYGV